MRRKHLVCFFLFLTVPSIAQDADNELWTGAAFRFDITKKIRLELENEVRFNNNISTIKTYFPELGIRYELLKMIDIKFQYRYVYRPSKNDRNRIALDVTYSWEKKKFPIEISNRLRFTDTKENNSLDKFTFLRDRIKLDYNLSKLADPFADVEIFYRFNMKNEFRAYRFKFGIEWRIAKDLDLDTFYGRENEFNVTSPSKDNIYGIKLTFNVDLKKNND